jgi:hypothetical protein
VYTNWRLGAKMKNPVDAFVVHALMRAPSRLIPTPGRASLPTCPRGFFAVPSASGPSASFEEEL